MTDFLYPWQTGDWQPGPALPLEPNNANLFAAAFSRDGRWLAATQNNHLIHQIGRAHV